MAFDAELVAILNDLVKFLELLSKEINLPDTLENDRSLVGTHLLLYATKNDKQPSDVISIRGYSARAATDYIKDFERSKSAFEIFCPGDRTYKFIARTPKEMEQWIAVICRAGVKKESETDNVDSQLWPEEEYQDVGAEAKENEGIEEVELRKKETIAGVNGDANPPPLPARIPRRLPSLPHEDKNKSVDFTEEVYYEDDIYQMVEEFKQPTMYQNVDKVKIAKDKVKLPVMETYDDIVGKKEQKVKRESKNFKDTYDDIHHNQIKEERSSVMYDDVEVVDNKNAKESPKKKSFLNRVRYKKDSKKEESKKKKVKNLPKKVHSSVKEIKPDDQDTKPDIKDAKPDSCDIRADLQENNQLLELPTYDDVSDLTSEFNKNTVDNNNMAEYNCPPAPRPIYAKPPTIPTPVKFAEEPEEFYDDIGSLRNVIEEKFQNNNEIVAHNESSLCVKDEQSRVKNLSQSELRSTTNAVDDELEHYQVPRSQEPIDSGQLDVTAATTTFTNVTDVKEELYDDIAILADFRARSRDSGCSSSSSDKTVNNVSKAWNRFASGRKPKVPNELTTAEKNTRRSSSQEFIDTCLDSHEDEGFKLNKFQKLINKMESSLNKTTKPISSIIHKSHDEN
ncbi:hypothetical protein G9C98_006677 [Cotesia typhae]|uniref:PH domain-containing protein n=1 Tax=Cotesia typhae TaxID=2053667 RepID=A0A8J5R0E9_9HYME|nr:hypothetical protein G9C98_006677 [Cotesia typhae]